MAAPRVGIDFGTSNSGVAIFDGQKVHMLPIDPENVAPEVVKTVLYISRDLKATIGQQAIREYFKNNINRPRRFVKKWAGEIDFRGADMFYVDDVFVLVDELMPGRLLQFIKTGLRSPHYTGTMIFDHYFDLRTIIANYLGEIKKRAEALLGDLIEAVTLGRPVNFYTDPEKDRKSQEILRQAALTAGFKDVDFELEPVAAALFYEQTLTRPETVLVFDFGGGTLDITIVRLGDDRLGDERRSGGVQRPGALRERRVFTNGGIGIAGSDFDQAIIHQRMLEHFGKGVVDDDAEINNLIASIADWQVLPQLSTPQMKARLGRAIAHNPYPTRLKALEALIFNDLSFQFYNKVEAAKIALSSQGTSIISMEDGDIHLWELLTRLQFEQDILPFRKQIEACLMDTLARSGLELGQIDTVIRTGGSSSIPCFIEMLNRIFGAQKVKTSDIFGSVAAGLAIKAFYH